MVTVLLIDDHAVVRSGFRRLLESKPDICVAAEADNGVTGCKLIEEHKPDVVILDLSMPGIDGLETIRRIKAKYPTVYILIFSMHSSEILIQRTLAAGATGYLTKQSGFDQMIQAVRQVSKGKLYVDKDVAFDTTYGIKSEDVLNILSKREFQIFKLIAEGNSTNEIAEILSISPKTVNVHYSNITKKLKLRNIAQIVQMGIQTKIIN